MKEQFKEYINDSWEKEMMKLPKEILLGLLKKELLMNYGNQNDLY